MNDLTIHNLDRALMDLLASRSAETGRSTEEIAKDALAKGLLWSAADRAAFVRRLQQMSTQTPPDTELLRSAPGDVDNELTADEALARIRSFRHSASERPLPDSTPGIRADREAR